MKITTSHGDKIDSADIVVAKVRKGLYLSGNEFKTGFEVIVGTKKFGYSSVGIFENEVKAQAYAQYLMEGRK